MSETEKGNMIESDDGSEPAVQVWPKSENFKNSKFFFNFTFLQVKKCEKWVLLIFIKMWNLGYSTSARVLRHFSNSDFLLVDKYRSKYSFGRGHSYTKFRIFLHDFPKKNLRCLKTKEQNLEFWKLRNCSLWVKYGSCFLHHFFLFFLHQFFLFVAPIFFFFHQFFLFSKKMFSKC